MIGTELCKTWLTKKKQQNCIVSTTGKYEWINLFFYFCYGTVFRKILLIPNANGFISRYMILGFHTQNKICIRWLAIFITTTFLIFLDPFYHLYHCQYIILVYPLCTYKPYVCRYILAWIYAAPRYKLLCQSIQFICFALKSILYLCPYRYIGF